MKIQNLKHMLMAGFIIVVFLNSGVMGGSFGIISRISISSNGSQGNDLSWYSYINEDGHYVVFSSYASNLVTNDTNNVEDVFMYDVITGITMRVSTSTNREQANGDSTRAKISNDGQVIAFTSTADNLIEEDNNGQRDLFIHDVQTGETFLVSLNSDGMQSAKGVSINISVSPNGNIVAFASLGSEFVVDDTNGDMDIFLHNIQLKETVRVSLASDGAESNNHSANPSLSEDGRFIAFQSIASNLVEGDTNDYCGSNYNGEYGDNCQDIFVHDQLTGETTRVSVASNGTEANEASWAPAISADGRFVVFSSPASNLVENDNNFYCDNHADGEFDDNCSDIFVHDLLTGETSRVSISTLGEEADGGSLWAKISANGRYVAYESWATNLVEDDTNNRSDIFVYDRWLGKTQRVSVSNSGKQGIWGAYGASLSADGRYVGFDTLSALVPTDTNFKQDVYVCLWQPDLLYLPIVARPQE